MRIDYCDNSFMLAWQHCRAWYDEEGRYKDGEYKRANGRVSPVQARHTKVIAWLEKQGYNEAKLLQRGILKRKTNV